MQDPQQSSFAGAASSNRAKKVRVSLFDTKKRLQIIVKTLGANEATSALDKVSMDQLLIEHSSTKKSARYGSVTFALKKLAQGAGNTFMQWVGLYDTLDDDIFDGQLGVDEWDTPRLLIEYSVIGGKFTSVMQGIERIREDIQQEHGVQEESGGGAPELRQKVVPKKKPPPQLP